MSGIAVSYGSSEEADLKRMLSKLEHRGELSGIESLDNISMGYRSNHVNQLIGDETPGESDTFSINGKACAVCDGYLFNDELFDHDNSSLVAGMFQEKGTRFVEDLEGTFALAVTDGSSFLVARDPFGIKPLYYGNEKGTTYFASEIKELVEVTEDINVFPPGHYYTPRHGFQPYGQVAGEKRVITKDPEKAARQLKQLMVQAVERRFLENERPGILLSGGLDSSVVAAAARNITENLETFSVGLWGSPDLEAARLVARHLGSKHREHVYTEEEIMQVLAQVIYHLESFDAPLVQSAIANYFASKLAAEAGCHSILCGEGADELFGGYHYVKDLGSEEAVEQELMNIISIGHAMGFQRVDRMNSAHSLESHVPFMDQDVVEFAAAVPLDWKIFGKEQTEKWILRTAFTHDLPEKIVWRRKAQFSHGTGCNKMMEQVAEARISDEEFYKAQNENEGIMLRTKEECLYYHIFKTFYPQDSAAQSVVQWSSLEGDNT